MRSDLYCERQRAESGGLHVRMRTQYGTTDALLRYVQRA
jgi:hypothetical protein